MIIMFFIIGAIIGSFLNVCIYRLPRSESIIYPGSHCPHCKQKLKYYHNIPLISYLFLGGRCSYCRNPISIRYSVVEFLSALLTVFAFLKFGLSEQLLFYLVLIYSLIVISFIDFEVHLILNKILIALIIFTVILNVMFNIVDWKEGFLGFVSGGGVLWLFSFLGKMILKKESMGMGDVKFAAVIGFFLGWKFILIALYIGFVIALIYYVLIKIINTGSAQKYIPMAPFFSFATILFLLYGNTISKYYMSFIGY